MVHCYGSLMIYARKIPAYMVVLLLRDFKAVTVKMVHKRFLCRVCLSMNLAAGQTRDSHLIGTEPICYRILDSCQAF